MFKKRRFNKDLPTIDDDDLLPEEEKEEEPSIKFEFPSKVNEMLSRLTTWTSGLHEDDTAAAAEVAEAAEEALEEALVEEGVSPKEARRLSIKLTEKAAEEGKEKRSKISWSLSKALSRGTKVAENPEQYNKKRIEHILFVKKYITENEWETMNRFHLEPNTKKNKITEHIMKKNILKPWVNINSYQIQKICGFLYWLQEQENVSYRLFDGKTLSDIVKLKRTNKIFRSISSEFGYPLYDDDSTIRGLLECVQKVEDNYRNGFELCLREKIIDKENITIPEKYNNKTDKKLYYEYLLYKQYIETMKIIFDAAENNQIEGYRLLLGMLSNSDGVKEFIEMFNQEKGEEFKCNVLNQ